MQAAQPRIRGFPINGAGPRDLQTGYPVGGTAAFVNYARAADAAADAAVWWATA